MRAVAWYPLIANRTRKLQMVILRLTLAGSVSRPGGCAATPINVIISNATHWLPSINNPNHSVICFANGGTPGPSSELFWLEVEESESEIMTLLEMEALRIR